MNTSFLSLPMGAGPLSRDSGMTDELGNPVYFDAFGQRYTIKTQNPNRESYVRAGLGALDKARKAPLESLTAGAQAIAQGAWDAVATPGRSWSDTVTYGDVANTAGLVSLPAVAGKYDPTVVSMSGSRGGKSMLHSGDVTGNVSSGRGALSGSGDAIPPQLAVRGPVGVGGGSVRTPGASAAYERTGVGGDAQPGGRLTPTQAGIDAFGDRVRDFEEVTDFDAFHAEQLAAQASHGPTGRSVSVYDPQYLRENGYRAFRTPDGSATFAVSPHGEVASVVTKRRAAGKGAVDAMLPLASEQGANWLQAFDTGLPELYGKHGYRPVSRLPFNREIAEGDWGIATADAFTARHGEPDLVFMARDPSFTGRNRAGKGGVRTDDWDTAQSLLDAEVERMKGRRTPTEAAYVDPRATGRADGSLGRPDEIDVTWNGLEPKDWTPQDWHDFGAAHGVGNLGPADQAAWERGLRTIELDIGPVSLPAGDEPFTYYDLLHLKAQGIDPNRIPPELHSEIHNRMVAGVSQNELTDEAVVNGMLMGMLSPNNPLTQNEFGLQRVMVKGPQDLNTLADMAGYNYLDDVPGLSERQAISRRMVNQLGLQAGDRGGLGVSGSANYADISEMAQKFRDRPDFFRFDTRQYSGLSDSEKWSRFVTEVMNETRGLKAKTGSFATVWQDPANASISAIDRHMATMFKDEMFPTKKAREAWHKKVINAYNASTEGTSRKKVRGWDQFKNAPGARSVFVDQVMQYVNALPTTKTRTAAGEWNKNIPEWMHGIDWVGDEPTHIQTLSKPYVRALEANAERAAAHDIGLFSSQWKDWDPIRGRIEPHEIMFRGLENLPRMSLRQMKDVRDAHAAAGYLTAPSTPQRVLNPSTLGYFSAFGAVPLGATLAGSDQAQY